jgi:outer membrane protein assembly factor BamB
VQGIPFCRCLACAGEGQTGQTPLQTKPGTVRVDAPLVSALVLSTLVVIGCGDRPGNPTASKLPPETAQTSQPSVTPIANRQDLAAGDWSRFRGPGGMGISSSDKLPLSWSGEENIAWKTPLPGAGASSPIIFGEQIYLTYYSGYFVPGDSGGSLDDLKRHLIAINRRDGSIRWDQPIAAKLPEEKKIRDHGFAASTAVADSDHVYVFFGKSGVFAFDHDGNQVWQADVGEHTNGWGSGASPVIWNDLLLVNASVESESLVALNRTTGERVWTAGGIKEAWNTPLVVTARSGRQEIIVPTQGTVFALAPQSGEKLWSCKTDIGWYMVPSAIAHDDVTYCFGGRSGVASLAIRTGGSGDVTATHRLWTSLKGSNVSSPVYHDRHLYWMHEQRGIAYCAVAETGEVVYEQRLDRAGQVYASALLADDRIYYLTRSGRTFVLAAKPEFEQLAVNELRDGGVFNASPVADNNRLLIRSDKYLYCISDADLD